VAFDYQDVYFSRSRGGNRQGEVWRIKASDGYANPEKVVTFAELDDASYYNSNAAFINQDDRKAGFGSTIKIFDEHNTSNKIMLVGATLFDPYVFNTLDAQHSPNPMGAVYIYKKSLVSGEFTYHGAVYSKGFTSENILSNVSSFRGGVGADPQFALFGYDFDYDEGKLVVSEPGGNGEDSINSGRAYVFDISSTPTLLKTYLASDISVPDPDFDNGVTKNIEAGDNFGSNVVLLGDDVLTWSDATLGQTTAPAIQQIEHEKDSTIYNLRSGSVFGFSFEPDGDRQIFSQEAIFAELEPYFSNIGLAASQYKQWGRILSIKKFRTQSKDRLLVVREFSQKSLGFAFAGRVKKLSVLDLERSPNGTLFIRGPLASFSDRALFTNAPIRTDVPLIVNSHISTNNDTTLFLSNFAKSMPLYIERLLNPSMPLYVDGKTTPENASVNLLLNNKEVVNDTSLFIPVIDGALSSIDTFVLGVDDRSAVSQGPLFIGEEIHANNDADLFLQTLREGENFTPGASLLGVSASLTASGSFEVHDSAREDLFLEGQPFEQVINQAPLFVRVPTPPISENGNFVGSGITDLFINGNNDDNVFAGFKADNTLYMLGVHFASGSAPLYMERPIGNSANLFIESRIASGVSDFYVDGANITASGIDLNIKTPEAKNITTFTRGFLE